MINDQGAIASSARVLARALHHSAYRLSAWAIPLAIVAALLPQNALAVAVAGRVIEHLTGNALGGIRIGIWGQTTPYNEHEIASTITAVDGTYAWSGTCPYRCSLNIDDERYLGAYKSFYWDATDFVADFSLLQPAKITGHIKVDGATPTNDIGVSISYYSDIDGRWMGVLNTYQEENGHYVISRLPPDVPYRVCAGGFDANTIEQCFNGHNRTSPTEDPTHDLVTVGEGEQRDQVNFDLSSGGGISGTIHDGYLDAPLADTQIVLTYSDEAGAYIGSSVARTDANGHYEAKGLLDGTFYLTASIDGGGPFVDSMQIYPGIVCENSACPPASNGTRLVIASGSSLTSIDFTVHPAVVFKGRVTDATTGQGLSGVKIHADSSWHPSAISTQNGDFIMYVGTGHASYWIYTRGTQPYIDQRYPGIPCAQYCGDGAQIFNPPRGSVIEHIDFALQPGAAIGGRIFDAATSLPLEGHVYVYDSNLNIVWEQPIYDGDDGTYLSSAWYPGTYYVRAVGYFGRSSVCAFYDGKPCPASDQDPATVMPTPITVGAGQILNGIDFHIDGDPIFRSGFEP